MIPYFHLCKVHFKELQYMLLKLRIGSYELWLHTTKRVKQKLIAYHQAGETKVDYNER